MSAHSGDQVIMGSRLKALGLTAIAATFVGIALWMLHEHATGFKAQLGIWIGIPLFGAATIFGIIQVIKPARLTLRADGFELSQPPKGAKFTPWSHVETFYIFRLRGNKFVAYTYTSARPQGVISKVGRAMGAQATLPNLFSMKTEELAGLMESRRRQAVGTAPTGIAAQPQIVS